MEDVTIPSKRKPPLSENFAQEGVIRAKRQRANRTCRENLHQEWLDRCSAQHKKQAYSRNNGSQDNTTDLFLDLPTIQSSELELQVKTTGLLFSELEQRMQEDPVAIVSRTLDILATHGEKDATLRTYCIHTVRSMTPLVVLDTFPATSNSQECRTRHVVDAILMSMNCHLGCSLVQVEAGRLLQRILIEEHERSTNEQGDRSYTKEVITTICLLMDLYPEDESLHWLLFDLLWRLKFDKSVQFLWLGSVFVLLQAIRRHPSHVAIQQIGQGILAWLAEDVHCRQSLILGDGARIIAQVMALHVNDPLIQCNAAAALCWLVHAGGLQGRCRLDTEHIPTIIQVLETHLDSTATFGNCVCLLCGLLESSSGIDIPHLVQLVLDGMHRHESSAQVQEGCLRWIRFRNTQEYQAEFKQAIPNLLTAIKRHADESHLQAQAMEVLTSFVGVDSLRDVLLELGAVDCVLDMLRRHKDNGRIQQGAVWFLTLSMRALPSTIAFGGGFNVLETVWQSLGIGPENEAPANEEPARPIGEETNAEAS